MATDSDDIIGDSWVDFPPVDQANLGSMRDALIDAAKALIEAGYNGGDIANALLCAGAVLANDLGGARHALAVLKQIATTVENAQNKSLVNLPPAGRA